MLLVAIGSFSWKKQIDRWGSRMCAIVDANVAHQVFSENRPSAGIEFFNWISSDEGSLVIGGKLRLELNRISSFRTWQKEAIQSGRVISVKDSEVVAETKALEGKGVCQSDDAHIIALAQISGARLLYSNDDKLQNDFKTKKLIDNPRGSVYSTLVNQDLTPAHRKLLQSNVCKK